MSEPHPTMATRFRIGSVPYLNAAPLTHGLPDVLRLPPSQLASELHAGRLDAALLSITEAMGDHGHEVLANVGILCRGPVFSVGVTHQVPLEQVTAIHLDPASCTSVNLLRVLLDSSGLRPRLLPLESPVHAEAHEATLLIGNPAIAFRQNHPTRPWWDLGEAWWQRERLPFVFAAWVLRRDAPRELRRLLADAARMGLARIGDIAREATDFDEPFRRAYLGGHVQYDLDAAARQGVERFVARLREATGMPCHAPRWAGV
jgi:chorismate dehydratase